MKSATNQNPILLNLLRELVQKNHGEAVEIRAEDNQPFGLFLPFPSPPLEPPKMTPEEEEELRYRLAHLDETMTTEEVIEMIRQDRASSISQS